MSRLTTPGLKVYSEKNMDDLNNHTKFVTWKEEENKTMSKYVRQGGCKTLQNGEIVMNYHCCRSWTYKPKGKGLKNLKSQGSAKIGISCPAVIKVKQSTENVVVHYFPKHQNHETQLEHLRLSESDRTAVADNENGRGNLVDKVMNSWPASHEFEPSTAEDPQCRGRCTKNLLMLKRSPVGVVWKLGKGVPAQVSFSSLDHAQDY
ncbi:MULE domain-containing protein [Trichonephila clavipes]|nr:MULE domain-containing protein [Trichonephila clavipes]